MGGCQAWRERIPAAHAFPSDLSARLQGANLLPSGLAVTCLIMSSLNMNGMLMAEILLGQYDDCLAKGRGDDCLQMSCAASDFAEQLLVWAAGPQDTAMHMSAASELVSRPAAAELLLTCTARLMSSKHKACL